jgi:hypothetical protein
MLDLDITTGNLILDEEIPVLNVLGSLGAGASTISSKEDGRFVVLVQNVVLNSVALILNEVLTPHDLRDRVIDSDEFAFRRTPDIELLPAGVAHSSSST